MAPQSGQFKCTGWLVWQEKQHGATCYGVTGPLQDAYVNLVAHHAERMKPSEDSTLHSLSCLGHGVYQPGVDDDMGTIPPPACLGLEFQRYRQAAYLQSAAAAAASDHAALHQQQHVGHDIELLHAEHVTANSDSTSISSSPSADSYIRHAAASASHVSTSNPATVPEGPEYHGRPSLVQRLQELHAEVSERLEGQDPLWFGKAFAARAALNWDSMKSMAGQVLESMKADLGLQQKPEEPK